MTRLPVLLVMIAVALTSARGFAQRKAPEHDRVHIHLTDPDGRPIPGIGFRVEARRALDDRPWLAAGVTDADGRLLLEVDVPRSVDRFFVMFIGSDDQEQFFDQAEQHRLKTAIRKLKAMYSMPFLTRHRSSIVVDVDPSAPGEHRFSLRAEPAIVATGRVTGPEGPLSRARVSARHANGIGTTGIGGRFEIVLPANTPNEVFVFHGRDVVSVDVPSSDAIGRRVRVDDVIFPERDGTYAADLSINGVTEITRMRRMESSDPLLTPGLTLISEDGKRIFTYISGPHGRPLVRYTEPEAEPILPAGVYYVAPGVFSSDRLQLQLLDLARDGLAAGRDLPRLHLGPGQRGSLHLDAPRLARQIETAVAEARPTTRTSSNPEEPPTVRP